MSNGMADAAAREKSVIVTASERLPRIKALSIEAYTAPGEENAGRGHGRIRVRREPGAAILFDEAGWFAPAAGRRRLRFHNALRWTVHFDRIVLAHRRHDAGHGTRLVDLCTAPAHSTDADLVCAEPHRCGGDCYEVSLRLVDGGFDMTWRITGPRKNQRLIHRYRRVAFDDMNILPRAGG